MHKCGDLKGWNFTVLSIYECTYMDKSMVHTLDMYVFMYKQMLSLDNMYVCMSISIKKNLCCALVYTYIYIYYGHIQ